MMTYDPKIELEEQQALEAQFEQLGSYSNRVKIQKMNQYRAAAQDYLKKDKRITIRISSHDLERLKSLAVGEGLPYQTYITSVLHKASTGRLKDTQAF